MSYIREDGVFTTDVTATVVGTNPFTVGYEMQYRSNSGAAWREFGRVSENGVFVVKDIAGLNTADGVTGNLVMDARFRAVNEMGMRGDWSGVKAYSLARGANEGPQAGSTSNERVWDYTAGDNVGSLLGLRKARGSLGSETAVLASDTVGSLDFYAHDGTSYDLVGRFQLNVDAISAGDISSTIVLKNTDTGGSLNPGMTIDPSGAVQISGVAIDGGFVDERDVSADGAALDLLVGGTFSGDAAFDTNTLFVDSANNRVGIGTTSPIGKFQSQQDTLDEPAVFIGRYNAEDSPLMEIGEHSIAGGTGGSFGGALFHAANRDIAFSTQNTADFSAISAVDLFIEIGGNVGIGTASPNAALDVNGAAHIDSGVSFDSGTTVFDTVKRMTAFTPVIADAGTGGNTGTISTNNCWWSQVDKQVHVYLQLTISSVVGMTGGNDLYIRMADLPDAHNSYEGRSGIGVSPGGQSSAKIEKNTDYIRVYDWTIPGYVTVTAAAAGDATIELSFMYDAV